MKAIKCFLLFAFVCTICCFSAGASAAAAYEQKINVLEKNSEVTVLIIVPQGETAGLQIIKPNADYPPDDSAVASEIFVYLGEVKGNESGTAAYTFNAGEEVGEYVIRSDHKIVITDNRLFAFVWSDYSTKEFDTVGSSYQDLYETVWVVGRNMQKKDKSGVYALDDAAVAAEAQRVAEKLEQLPEGRRCVALDGTLCNMLFRDTSNGVNLVDNYVWLDEGEKLLTEYIDKFFSALKDTGAKVDYAWSDCEKSITVYDIRQTVLPSTTNMTTEQVVAAYTEVFKNIQNDERYAEDIRTQLEEYGFPFDEEGETELSQLTLRNDIGNKGCMIWNGVMKRRIEEAFNSAVYEAMKKHFPDIKFSNYGFIANDAWHKMPNKNGQKPYLGGSFYGVGTHSSRPAYGQPYTYLKSTPPEDLAGSVYPLTQFNVLRYEQNYQRTMYLSTEGNKIQPWVGTYDYAPTSLTGEDIDASKIADSPYYAELIYHTAMLNPDPFLLFGLKEGFTASGAAEEQLATLAERAGNFSELLQEINSLVGYKDRTSLADELVSWNKPYIITGMRANGRDVYRITPDISAGVTKESFCTDFDTPTFEIDGDIITFPDGKILTPETTIDSYGYWVEMSEGEEPQIVDGASEGDWKIKDFEVYDIKKGIVLEKEGVLPREGFTVRCSVRNDSARESKLVLTMAQYDADGLMSLETLQNKAFKSGEEKIIIEEIPAAQVWDECERVAVFLWDTNLYPYKGAYKLIKSDVE